MLTQEMIGALSGLAFIAFLVFYLTKDIKAPKKHNLV